MTEYTSKNLPPSFSSFVTSVASIDTRSTRLASSHYSFYLPIYKILKLQRNNKFRGVKTWNLVSLEIKSYPAIDLKYNIRSRDVEAVKLLIFPLLVPLKNFMLPSSLPLPHLSNFLLPLPAPDRISCFRFQSLSSKFFLFPKNLTTSTSSFRFHIPA